MVRVGSHCLSVLLMKEELRTMMKEGVLMMKEELRTMMKEELELRTMRKETKHSSRNGLFILSASPT